MPAAPLRGFALERVRAAQRNIPAMDDRFFEEIL
jgi:hypothetical protein